MLTTTMLADLWDYLWYDLMYDIADEIPRTELLPSFRELCVGIWSHFCAALCIWVLLIPVGNFLQRRLDERSPTTITPADEEPLDTASLSIISLGADKSRGATPRSPFTNNATSPTNILELPVESIQLPEYVKAPPFKNFSGNDAFIRRNPLTSLSPDRNNVGTSNDLETAETGVKRVDFCGGWQHAFTGGEPAVEIQDEGIIELSDHPTDWFALAQDD